jgi:hypothetical protein
MALPRETTIRLTVRCFRLRRRLEQLAFFRLAEDTRDALLSYPREFVPKMQQLHSWSTIANLVAVVTSRFHSLTGCERYRKAFRRGLLQKQSDRARELARTQLHNPEDC